MKQILLIFSLITALTACGEKPKDFSGVLTGMTKTEVSAIAGEPDKQNDIGATSFWAYRDADRTVVFRKDTVYNIITSTEARLDSINGTLEKADDKIAAGINKIGNVLDSAGRRLKKGADSLTKK